MNQEKIITLENGDRVKIEVHFYLHNNQPFYHVDFLTCKKGKRKFQYDEINKNLKKKLGSSIKELKNELWHKLAPYENNEGIIC